MNRKSSIVLGGILLVGISTSALAVKPPETGKPPGVDKPEVCKPEKPVKPDKPAKPEKPERRKAALMHCGCSSDGTGLEWKYLVVSSKSKGHRNHLAGDVEECYVPDGDAVTLIGTYTRDYDDCTINADALLDIEQCEEVVPIEGESCGSEYVAPDPE